MNKITAVLKIITNNIIKYHFILLLAFSYIVIAEARNYIFYWGKYYLSDLGYNLPTTNKPALIYNLCMPLGLLVAGWGSDKFFSGRRCDVNIFFHFGILLLLLTLLLISPNFVVSWYSHIIAGTSFFYFGLHLLILLTAIELSDKKVMGTVFGLFMAINLYAPALTNLAGGYIMRYTGNNWKNLLIVVCVCVVLSALGMWHCRSLEKKYK